MDGSERSERQRLRPVFQVRENFNEAIIADGEYGNNGGRRKGDTDNKDSTAVGVGGAKHKDNDLIPPNVDKILCERLNNLSMEEREKAIHELHGVADNHEELTEEMIRTKLSEITTMIDGSFFEEEETKAYQIALKKIQDTSIRSNFYV